MKGYDVGILGGGVQRKVSEYPPEIDISKISGTHAEQAVQDDHLSRLGDTQESAALVTPHLTVHDNGQVQDMGHPVIGFGACGVASQGGMVVWKSPRGRHSTGVPKSSSKTGCVTRMNQVIKLSLLEL